MDMEEPINQGWVLNNISLQKIIKNSIFEDKDIEKYALFRKTIFLLWEKKFYIYLCCL